MKFALITGGSGGIGLSIAKELARRKYGLLLVARSEHKLRSNCRKISIAFKTAAHYLALDLAADNADGKLMEWVLKNKWPVAILVNNAGYALWGNLNKIAPEDTQNMMRLNTNTLVGLCTRCIPLLSKQPSAYILNVASTAAYQAVPTLSVYAATKSFVVTFTRGLRWELKNTTISVSCVSPGVTATGFMDRAKMEALKETANKLSMTPDQVAKIAIKGMFNKKTEIIPGFINKFSVLMVNLLPKRWTEKAAHSIYNKN